MFLKLLSFVYLFYALVFFNFFFLRLNLKLLLVLEIFFLILNLNLAIFAFFFDDLLPQIFILLLFGFAASESSLGLAVFLLTIL